MKVAKLSPNYQNPVNALNIDKNIIAIRKHFKLSQGDFSKKLGISKATVSLWENGKKYPSKKNLEKLAKEFNLKPQDLFNNNIHEMLGSQSQFKFRASVFNIKPGLDLYAETEKLSKKDIASIDKAVEILKVFF